MPREHRPVGAENPDVGHPVDVEESGLAADPLGARRVGTVAWSALSRAGAESVLVDDDDIRSSQRVLWDALHLVVEPGGAAALAALRAGAYRPEPGERVAAALCGTNCDPATVMG